jgi:hypothetical protein
MAMDPMAPVGSGSSEQTPPDEDAYRHFEDLATGIIFLAVGAAAFVVALGYPGGTMHRMGPGMFPVLISGLLTAIGIGLAIQSLLAWRLHAASRPIPRPVPKLSTLRALFFVMLSLLAFAMLVRPAGLFIATGVLTFISTRAEAGRSVMSSLVLSAILAVICSAIFVYGIGLPIPLWP